MFSSPTTDPNVLLGWPIAIGVALLAVAIFFSYLIFSGKILNVIWQVKIIDKRLHDIANSHKKANSLLLDMVTELNRPLHNMFSTCEMLLHDYNHPGIKTIYDNLNNLILQLKQVQTYAEVSTDMITVNRFDTHLKPFLVQVVEDFQPLAAKKGIEFHYSIPDQPEIISVDPAILRVCLQNLLKTSLLNTNEGKIYFKVEVETIYPKVANLKISIKDTGHGYTKGQGQQLLNGEVFGNSEFTESTKNNLTVYTSKLLCERIAGELSLESEIGFGSTFTVVIPVFKGAEGGLVDLSLDESNLPSPNTKILVVDDEPIALNVVKNLLGSLGYRADTATDGEEAVEKCQTTTYDMIFMDIQMPLLNGWEATRKIKKLDNNKDVKIFALTSNSRSHDVRKSYQVGMDSHLTKPLSQKELRKILLEVAEGRLPQPPPLEEEPVAKVIDINSRREIGAKDPVIDLGPKVDLEYMLSEYGYDKELVANTIELSFRSIRDTLPELLQYIDKRELTQLFRKAHFIKGLCLNLFWVDGANLAKQVEELAKERESFDPEKAYEVTQELESRVVKLERRTMNELDDFKTQAA